LRQVKEDFSAIKSLMKNTKNESILLTASKQQEGSLKQTKNGQFADISHHQACASSIKEV
jgi:hypothetical protein